MTNFILKVGLYTVESQLSGKPIIRILEFQ